MHLLFFQGVFLRFSWCHRHDWPVKAGQQIGETEGVSESRAGVVEDSRYKFVPNCAPEKTEIESLRIELSYARQYKIADFIDNGQPHQV